MTRSEQLQTLADVLQLAAEKARKLAPPASSSMNREIALATQIEGIAMEYRVFASEARWGTQLPQEGVAIGDDTAAGT